MAQLERITHHPGVMGGKPCIRGLRVTVGMIVGQIAGGSDIQDILDDYPYLQNEDVLQAHRYAAWRSKERLMEVAANVAVLDKKQGSFKQVTSSGAVKNDLVISAYKPKKIFHARFHERAGEGMEEKFIRMHLGQLPVEPSIERTEQMLYSKLLAYYVQRGYTIKYNAVTFFKMLEVEFVQEDAYWFLPEQLPSYNDFKQKMQLGVLGRLLDGQGGLFVSDEKSAIIWLVGYLSKPQSFQSIHPAFYRIASLGSDKMPELKDILAENFVLDGDRYRLPQSEQEKLALTEKRQRGLLREFEALLLDAQSSKKKIKEVRKQAVLFGFEDCYRKQRYQDILLLARRLHPSILENDSELNEFAEIAEVKVEGM